MSSEPTLDELSAKLAEEERAYADLLAKLDALSSLPTLYDRQSSLPDLLQSLNASAARAADVPEKSSGVKGLLRGFARRLLEPELQALRLADERQREFDSTLVRFLNSLSESANRASASQAEFASGLVSFSQRIDRLVDAKDRLYASLGNTRADLLLEGMEQRLDSARLSLRRLREQLEGLQSSTALARAELRGLAGRIEGDSPAKPPPSSGAFEAEHYVAFEDRYRGESSAIRDRLLHYVELFGAGPVLDLGCGRGEFLEILKESDIDAFGVDGNQDMVRVCRDKGLDAEAADLFDFLERRDESSAGGIFSAQVVEHLPPPQIRRFLDLTYRAVRPGGSVVIETVNPESVAGLVGFYRDLTHHKPLHPNTLDFLMRAAGFREVSLRYLSPVEERARLLRVPDSGPDADAINHNFDRLNAFLFGDLDYAAIGTK